METYCSVHRRPRLEKMRRFLKAQRRGSVRKAVGDGKNGIVMGIGCITEILEEIWQGAWKCAIHAFFLIRQSWHLSRFDERARW